MLEHFAAASYVSPFIDAAIDIATAVGRQRQLKRDCMTEKNEVTMLLLGAIESGKVCRYTSFIFPPGLIQQMKLIHHGSSTETERICYKDIIFSSTIQSILCVYLISAFLSNRIIIYL